MPQLAGAETVTGQAGEGAQLARWHQSDNKRLSSFFETALKWTDVKVAAETCPLALPRISALVFPIMHGHVNRTNYGLINNVGRGMCGDACLHLLEFAVRETVSEVLHVRRQLPSWCRSVIPGENTGDHAAAALLFESLPVTEERGARYLDGVEVQLACLNMGLNVCLLNVCETGEVTQRGKKVLSVHPQLQLVSSPEISRRWACLTIRDNHWQLVVKNHGEGKCELLHTEADIALLCTGKSTTEAATYGVERHLGENGIVQVSDVLIKGLGDAGALECKTSDAADTVRNATAACEEAVKAAVAVWREEMNPKTAKAKKVPQQPYGVAAAPSARPRRSVRAWVSGARQVVTATSLC